MIQLCKIRPKSQQLNDIIDDDEQEGEGGEDDDDDDGDSDDDYYVMHYNMRQIRFRSIIFSNLRDGNNGLTHAIQ